MIPLWDNIPRTRLPIITLALIAANCFVFFQEIAAPAAARDQFIMAFSVQTISKDIPS